MIPFTTIIPADTGAGVVYIPVPADMTCLGFSATHSTATGCVSSVTASSGSTVLGTAAIGAAVAAATITNATMSTTTATRKTKLTKAIPLKIAVDDRTNSAAIYVTAYMDEFALQSD